MIKTSCNAHRFEISEHQERVNLRASRGETKAQRVQVVIHFTTSLIEQEETGEPSANVYFMPGTVAATGAVWAARLWMEQFTGK